MSIYNTPISLGRDDTAVFGCQEWRLGVVLALLEQGADVNLPGPARNAVALNVFMFEPKGGSVPLIFATKGGHLSVVVELLEQGAYVDVADNKRLTALFYASRDGCMAIVKELLYCGASVTARGGSLNATALFYASWEGHLEVVKELLHYGAEVDALAKFNFTALFVASEKGHVLRQSQRSQNFIGTQSVE
ncbi:Aste57867_10829 [Aphanomyces stellatus]|uniref:Aste57867_10829 protein n=1 Tax=Aphanomyces stellatus TaxID=120398 RepID=A0A485KRC2_9STRA|nr:hypothetical protein As57867_010789 [Aphanomyces stellatus]VFT87697.1 Aste57867_10829 [Aphanomyces stellatus]